MKCNAFFVKPLLFDRLLFIGDVEIGTADIDIGRSLVVKRKIQNLQ
jgi:hypothetical protein